MIKALKLRYLPHSLLILVFIISFVVGQVIINSQTAQKEFHFEQRLELIAASKLSNIKTLVDDQVSSVLFLAKTPPVQGIYRAINNAGLDLIEDTTGARWKERLGRIFIAYMRVHPEIHQLRYIGVENNGRELVRVNRDKQLLEMTNEEQLQSKNDRDYFQEILALNPGQHYISRINLNQEYGQLEYPYRPTIRVAEPVLGNDRKVFGFIIANVDVGLLLQSLKQPSGQVDTYLLDSEGNFLAHHDSQKEFRFEFGEALTWGDLFLPAEKYNDSETLLLFNAQGDVSKNLFGTMHRLALNPGADSTIDLSIMVADDLSEWDSEIAILSRNIWMLVFAVAGFFIIVISVFQRHIRNQNILNKQLVEFESIFQGSMDAIFCIDAMLQIKDCNRAANDLLRQSSQFIMGRDITSIFPELQALFNKTSIGDVLQNKPAAQLECNYLLPNGTELVILLSLFKAYEGTEKELFGLIAKDITESVMFQQQIQEANERLEDQVKIRTIELQKETEKALKANETINAFVANISHELRTPINGVMGMLSALQGKPLEQEVGRKVGLAYQSAEHLLSMVNNILDISKIEAGKVELGPQKTDLRELFSFLLNTLVVLVKNDVQLLVDLSGVQHPIVYVDGFRLKQIVSNLLSNAIKFTAHGEVRLTVSTALTENNTIALQVSVSDTGIGIEEDKIPQLFNKFTQEDVTTTRQYGGTGLGLAIAKELTVLMSGEINVVSEKNRGTTFTLSFEFTSVIDAEDKLLSVIEGLGDNCALLCIEQNELQKIIKSQLTAWGITVEEVTVEKLLIDDSIDAETKWLFVSDTCFQRYASELKEKIKKIVIVDTQSGQSITTDFDADMQRLQAPITPIALAVGVAYCAESLEYLDHKIMEVVNQDSDVGFVESTLDLREKCILIVDDNMVNISVAEALLEDSNAILLHARNGKEAIEQLLNAEHLVRAILMDCQMPVMDGYSSTMKIRAGAAGIEYVDIPIIAMTAGAMPGDRARCISSGMNDYLAKPVIRADLYRKLAQFITDVDYVPKSAKGERIDPLLEASLADCQNLADLNSAAALERLGGGEGLLHKIQGIFTESYEEKLTSLKDSLDSQNHEQIKFSAHGIKGVCASVGLDKAAQISLMIELNTSEATLCKQLYEELVLSI